jgi:hypothetical protein
MIGAVDIGGTGRLADFYRGSIFCPETEDRMVLRLCAQPVRFPVQSKGEWLAILWLKVVSTTPLERPNWFARDCAPLAVQKQEISPHDVLVKRREEIVEVHGAMVRRIATVYERYPDRGR